MKNLTRELSEQAVNDYAERKIVYFEQKIQDLTEKLAISFSVPTSQSWVHILEQLEQCESELNSYLDW